jgi:hypothetical protein
MRTRWIAVAAAGALVGATGLAHAGSLSSIGVTVSIAGPRAAEMSSWTDLRVELKNTGQDSAQAHVTLTVPDGSAQPSGAEGAQCSGTTTVECVQTIAGGSSVTLALPVRWDGTGSRSVEAKARMQAGGSTAEASASSSVTVYSLVLTDREASAARAGRSFVASAVLARSDTGQTLAAHAVKCAAALATAATGGKTIASLAGKATVDGSKLECSWRLPKSAHGRFVRALVLADTHAGGMQTRYPLVRRVR